MVSPDLAMDCRWRRTRRHRPETLPRIAGVDRRRRYFVLMGICLALIISAWFVVRLYSTTAAIVMSLVAVPIPPLAAIVANRGEARRPRTPRRRW